jgi:hypothetical protein
MGSMAYRTYQTLSKWAKIWHTYVYFSCEHFDVGQDKNVPRNSKYFTKILPISLDLGLISVESIYAQLIQIIKI